VKYNLEDAYALKHIVENLFGRHAWLEIKHATDVTIWKKYSIKILSAIEFSAKATVEVADDGWFKELKSQIGHGKKIIKLTKETEQVFAALAAALANISFLQLGRVPSNITRSKITLRHPKNWKLNQYRSVQYVQTKEQVHAKRAHNKSFKPAAQKVRSLDK